MKLHHEFEIPTPIEQSWQMFTDLKALAPCMPGAQLEASEGDEHRGSIKVKLGPISATYAGVAEFESLDRAGRTAVLRAQGADTRGQGKASALITASFSETGTGTRVAIDTDLTITGKVAQFGRGVVADVSDKLLGEFVDRVHQTLLADSNGVAPDLADSSVNALAFLGVPSVRRRLFGAGLVVLVVIALSRRRRRFGADG